MGKEDGVGGCVAAVCSDGDRRGGTFLDLENGLRGITNLKRLEEEERNEAFSPFSKGLVEPWKSEFNSALKQVPMFGRLSQSTPSIGVQWQTSLTGQVDVAVYRLIRSFQRTNGNFI